MTVIYEGLFDDCLLFLFPRLTKKLEHTWKSVVHDGDTVSVHRPDFYANRFKEFMAKNVFKKIPRKLIFVMSLS